ncbi:MAG: formate--tetrahydrofolate ligase, partial [Nocardioidaceae bacterium]|nr:formate--tetrahydrofolate ligase [Nocardioidaceae bacterium]
MDDLEIARAAQLLPISQVADTLGLDPSTIEPYGRNVAKIDLDEAAESGTPATRAKYVVVSAITPTPLGEGKTTTVVG